MKKLFGFLLIILLSLQISYSAPWSGSGTVADPYQITNLSELQSMNSSLSSHFILMNDIDASATTGWNGGTGFMPIGNLGTKFTGSFNGNGKTISNLFIDRSGTSHQGFFGIIENASINNLYLVDLDITGNHYTGGLTGWNLTSSTIDNCSTSGTVSGSDHVGGICGTNTTNSLISYSSSSCTVSGNDKIGGLCGWNNNSSTITNCTSSGDMDGDEIVGGLCGYNYYSTISNSFSSGNANGTYHVGGLCGLNHAYSTISKSSSSGDADGTTYVGGLCGFNYFSTTITNCYSTGSASGISNVGGLCGRNHTSTVTDSYSTGSASGSSGVGGFCGSNISTTITSCFWDTQTSGIGSSAGGTPKTTAQMKQQATFSGWDFTNTWFMIEDESYPLLGVDSIPTLTEWAAIFMGILFAGFGAFFIFRRMG